MSWSHDECFSKVTPTETEYALFVVQCLTALLVLLLTTLIACALYHLYARTLDSITCASAYVSGAWTSLIYLLQMLLLYAVLTMEDSVHSIRRWAYTSLIPFCRSLWFAL